MISSIRLIDVATYRPAPVLFDSLLTVNFFYGANGSGKTSISRVVAEPATFPSCQLVWKDGIPLETLVYNRDFVERHFHQVEELPGIFTLGDKDAEFLKKIEKANKELERIKDDLVGLKKTLVGDDGKGGKVGALALAEETLKTACWKQKQQHDNTLKEAFEGCRSKAEAFKQRVLDERASNKSELMTMAYIQGKAATLFADNIQRAEPLVAPDASSLFAAERSSILGKKILGKSDVDVAEMIRRLGNSDWVREGRTYLSLNEKKCPFCQQGAPNRLEDDLNDYFDESFERDTKEVLDLEAAFETASKTCMASFDRLVATQSLFADNAAIAALKKQFETLVALNRTRLLDKKREPSRIVGLESSEVLIADLGKLVNAANDAISAHNSIVTNLAKERATLKGQVWKHLTDDALKDALKTYDQKKGELDKTIANLKAQIEKKEIDEKGKEAEIRMLESDVTSIQPTVNAINGLLLSFGFHGFSLAQAESKRCYKLVRPDGTDAKLTLSEGERTFVTFLYFYHLLKGSASESGVTNKRVVVIDDPVSSLDSDILFIVSTLIRKLCEDIRLKLTSVQQVFLLTHNVYFHKEVTFHKSRRQGAAFNDETFWTVRKTKNQSEIAKHASNPIKSSYELLWLDVRERRAGNLSIQNSLRRILETYFKMLGGMDLDKIHERFTGNEKLACRALLSWVNDGSHSAHDDLYVAVDDSTVDVYLDVFQRIFDGEGHIEHYNMMMASPPTIVIALAS
jgi:wobble nucleotide-excising tRNase